MSPVSTLKISNQRICLLLSIGCHELMISPSALSNVHLKITLTDDNVRSFNLDMALASSHILGRRVASLPFIYEHYSLKQTHILSEIYKLAISLFNVWC
jgi:hypothetical protein